MALKKLLYDVHLGTPETPDDQVETHRVRVILADQLVGEMLAARLGITTDSPLRLTTCWLWAAMKRTGVYGKPWEEFQGDCLDFDQIKPGEDVVDGFVDDGALDPTPAGLTASPAPSPSPIPAHPSRFG